MSGNKNDAEITTTRFGFIYGAAHVERIGDEKGNVAIWISGGKGKAIEIHVSPAGRSVRAFDQDGAELTAGDAT